MSDDIVKRLRTRSEFKGQYAVTWIQLEAADEIERLRAQVARLSKIVHEYYRMHPAFRAKPIGAPGSIIRAVHDESIALEDRAVAALKETEQ